MGDICEQCKKCIKYSLNALIFVKGKDLASLKRITKDAMELRQETFKKCAGMCFNCSRIAQTESEKIKARELGIELIRVANDEAKRWSHTTELPPSAPTTTPFRTSYTASDIPSSPNEKFNKLVTLIADKAKQLKVKMGDKAPNIENVAASMLYDFYKRSGNEGNVNSYMIKRVMDIASGKIHDQNYAQIVLDDVKKKNFHYRYDAV